MINIIETIKLAIAGVTSNKLRSFLTLLGIIIGTGAVILMISLGSATEQIVTGQFDNIIKRQIIISANRNLPYQQRGKLSLEDKRYLTESIEKIKQIISIYSFKDEIKYNSQTTKKKISASNVGIIKLTNLNVKYGRTFTEADIKNGARVAVVGEQVMEQLINLTDYSTLVGNNIYVNGRKFLIIGILGKTQSSLMDSNRVLVPSTIARQVWPERTKYVHYYLTSYSSSAVEKNIKAKINYLLDKKYGTTAAGHSKFRLQGLAGQMKVTNKIVTGFTYLLGGVAAISLLVGGIGIMNIMLVTVKERTREIGIRLAIGATRTDIQQQFLVETVILSLGGGTLGVICGSIFTILVNFGLSQFFDWWQGTIPLWGVLISFTVTALIGIIFGFYPACKASQLDPVDALRHE